MTYLANQRAGRVFVCALIAFGFSLLNARAATVQHVPASPICISEADATAQVRAFVKANDGASLEVLDGEDAKAWMDVFNTALPPVTDYAADKLWVISNPKDDPDFLYVALFRDGRTCQSIRPPRQIFEAIRDKVRGN